MPSFAAHLIWTDYLLEELSTRANRYVGANLTEDELRRIFQENIVVFAVWNDPDEPGGLGALIVQGQHALDRIVEGAEIDDLAFTALPCRSRNEADELRRLYASSDPER